MADGVTTHQIIVEGKMVTVQVTRVNEQQFSAKLVDKIVLKHHTIKSATATWVDRDKAIGLIRSGIRLALQGDGSYRGVHCTVIGERRRDPNLI